jgi:hypothetical protein
VVEKDGILYEVFPIDNGIYQVFAYNPPTNQWESIGYQDADFMRSLGYMDYNLWNRSIQVPSGRVEERHDGSDWVGIKSVLTSGAGNLKPVMASSDLFFAIGKTINPKPIYYSSDGLLWNTTGLSKDTDNHITAFGSDLVLINGSTSTWFDGYSTRSMELAFDTEEFRSISQFARYEENYLMKADFGGTDYLLHSTDLLNWKRTNLDAFILPGEFGQLESGLWYVYYPAGEEVYVSQDRISWSLDESIQIPDDPDALKFSMGLIKGNQFSEDGLNWINLPFNVTGVVETEQRIIFNSSDYLWNGSYLDKFEGGESPARNPSIPYITKQVYGLVGEPLQIEVAWGGLPRNDVQKIEIIAGNKPVGEFDKLPASLSIYPDSFSRQSINCLVHRVDGRIERYELGDYFFRFLRPILIDGIEDDTTVLRPLPWGNGWKAIFQNKVYESLDMYEWRIDSVVSLPVESITAFEIAGESWYMAGSNPGSNGEEHYSSADGGLTWSSREATFQGNSLTSIEGKVAVVIEPGQSAYSIDGINWVTFPYEPASNAFFHYEKGYLYYAGSFKKLIRLDLATGQATEWANSAIAFGAGVYVQYDLSQSDRVGIYSLDTGEELLRVNELWRIPRDIHFVQKAGNYITIEGEGARYSGSINEGMEKLEPFDIILDSYFDGAYPPVGPHGISIGEVELLEWDYTSKPISRLRFEVRNAFPIPLSTDQTLTASVEWIHPETGEVAGQFETSFNLFLRDLSSESIYLEVDAPAFLKKGLWNVVLSISGDPDSGIRGLFSTIIEAIPVGALAQININLEGNGSVQYDRPGPFAAGSTVSISPRAKEGYVFSHWRIPQLVGEDNLKLKVSKANDVEAIFLPPGIAAIDRWAKRLSPVESQWYSGSGRRSVFLSETGWAHSDETSWMKTIENGDFLFSWSPVSGWTCTRTAWFPFHWSFDTKEWIYFQDPGTN